jgi:hypothetical protein
MKLQYQQLNPPSNSFGKALERLSIRSPSIQYVRKALLEIRQKYGINPTELVTLDDKRNPRHQDWLNQNPKNADWVANKSKQKQSFFLKWVTKPIANLVIIPIAASLALTKKNFSAPNDRKIENSNHLTETNTTNQLSPHKMQYTVKEKNTQETNKIIRQNTTISEKKIRENLNATAALSPVSSIKAPGSINLPRPGPQASPKEENARMTSKKPLSTKPKDPNDLY